MRTKWEVVITVEKGFLGLAVLLGIFYIILGVGSQVRVEFSSIGERIMWGLGTFLSGAAILVGLRLSKRIPLLGGGLVVAGAIPLGYSMWWTYIMPILALVVAVFGVVRAFRFARERRAVS